MAISRRTFLKSGAALLVMPQITERASAVPLRLTGFNYVTLTVSDLQRSIDFYQSLFGLTLQARQGAATATFRVGSGPQNLGLTTQPSSGDRRPQIDHLCIGLEQFDMAHVLSALAEHGIVRSEQRGAMRVQVRMRGPDAGGALEGTPEVYVGDPDGVIVQLQDASYCGGAGRLGNVCTAPEPSPKKGVLAIVGYSHCTIAATDRQRSNAFYRQLFGMPVRAYQGPNAPALAVGTGVEFLMVSDGGTNAAQSRAGGINHVCFSTSDFDVARTVSALEQVGVRARENPTGAVGPLRHYVSMRMENRGGAKEGTPELYFTDPDGILIQLQDVSYCGGAGRLGELCPAL